jgi:rSAM/selenodomain-associated transferase 1
VDVSQARAVAILTRAPASGGKRRLFAALGCSPDESLLSALLLDTIDGLAGVDATCVIAVEPPDARGELRALVPDRFELLPQPDGDLGQRMQSLMVLLFERGARAVVLIGSDLPEMTVEYVEAAFTALDREPEAIVIGPAADGGYCLIAATRAVDVFDGIEWSSERVLAQTQAAATRCSRPTLLLPLLGDVDTPEDLRRVLRRTPATRTALWARAHGIRA